MTTLPDAAAAPLAAAIEHTLLRPEASEAQIHVLCQEARRYGFFAVCVHAVHLPLCVEALRGSQVRRVTVVGFPLGACPTATKAFAAREAVRLGAQEVDMVLPLWALKQGAAARVEQDIAAVVAAVPGTPVKVILETGLLDREEKQLACRCAEAAGAAFVKTCSGFAPGSATVKDVALLRATVGAAVGIKASGGIRDPASAVALLRAGATRLGTSASVALVSPPSP